MQRLWQDLDMDLHRLEAATPPGFPIPRFERATGFPPLFWHVTALQSRSMASRTASVGTSQHCCSRQQGLCCKPLSCSAASNPHGVWSALHNFAAPTALLPAAATGRIWSKVRGLQCAGTGGTAAERAAVHTHPAAPRGRPGRCGGGGGGQPGRLAGRLWTRLQRAGCCGNHQGTPFNPMLGLLASASLMVAQTLPEEAEVYCVAFAAHTFVLHSPVLYVT